MTHGRDSLLLVLALGTFMAAPPAHADALGDWLEASATCVETLAGFNEGRPWVQLKIADGQVSVLVESGGRDNVLVELSCSSDGMGEGGTYEVPEAISGGDDLPDERLARDAYDRDGLAALVERGRRLAGVRGQVPTSLVVTSLAVPEPTVQTTVGFGAPDHRSVNFDASGREVEDRVPPQSSWTEPVVDEQPSMGIESPIRSSAKVMAYLEGALGSKTVLHRLIVDGGMVTAAYDYAAAGYVMRQWTVDGGSLDGSSPASPIDAELAKLYKRCSRPATIGQLPAAYANLGKKLGKRIDAAIMLTLDCYANDGKAIQWELLGGDGKLVEGQPLLQEKFPYQP